MTISDSRGRELQRPPAPTLVAAAVVVAVLATLPWADRMLTMTPGLLPAWLATLLTCDVVTAVLLLGRSRGGASPRLVVLAAGYLWASVFVIGSALTIPGVVTTRGVVPDADVMWWFWVARHVVPPLCIAFALVPWPTHRPFGTTRIAAEPRAVPTEMETGAGPAAGAELAVHSRLVGRVVVPVLGTAVTIAVLGLVAPSWFPAVSNRTDVLGLTTRPTGGELVVVTAVNVVAVAAALGGFLVRRSHSRLEAWAVVAAAASLGEVLLTALDSPGYTASFFVSRGLGLVAALVVLCFVLGDLFAVHRRTAADAARLLRQNEELREAARLRDHLAAVVSHEMRTPLAGLQGYLELMSEDPDVDEVTNARMLERSWLLTRRLTLLAEDLLAVATSEHGEFVVIPENLHLAHQLDETAACFPDLDLRIVCPPDLMVRADNLRLQQVLTNLVRNAQKHGAEPVTITAGTTPAGTDQPGGSVTIRVADSGAGVPRDFVHRLFDRYAQGANPGSGGSGLGLAVVRDLVRAHGGSVRYDLTDPAFVVTLPRQQTLRPVTPSHLPRTVTLPNPTRQPLTSVATELTDLPFEADVEVPDTLSHALVDLVSGVAKPMSAPLSALEAFTMLNDEHPDPGAAN